MSLDDTLARNELFSSMESERPYASYIKTILGQLGVTVWDNILDKPVEVILKGDPKRKEEGCVVRLWTAKENVFFKRQNLKHFKAGRLIPYNSPQIVEEVSTIAQATDEELSKIVNSKYFSLVNKLNEIDSVAVLFRMLALAEDMDKSEKITKSIQARISELQTVEYPKRLEVEVHPEE